MSELGEVERELTVDKLHVEWTLVLEKEYMRVREFQKQVLFLQDELEGVEGKWAVKLEDAVEEIGLLKMCLEEKERDEVAPRKKHAALSWHTPTRIEDTS